MAALSTGRPPTDATPGPKRSLALLLLVALIAAACAPGSGAATPAASRVDVPSGRVAGSGEASPTVAANASGPQSVPTALPAGPVTLRVLHDTDDYYTKLFAEFQRQYPSVTIDDRSEAFSDLMTVLPRLVASSDAPDLVRLPSVGTLVRDHLLLNLDPYAQAYGWDGWTSSLIEQMRVAPDGVQRGTGSLYQMMAGGWSITGVFYNKTLASQIGMTQPPATVADFETLLAKAKAAGLVPIQQGSDSFAFPFQALLDRYANIADVKAWLYRAPGATIATPAATQAAQTLQDWGSSGYFQKDLAEDGTAALGNFQAGAGVFFFSGDWMTAPLSKSMAGNVGFFRFPPLQPGGPQYDMGAPFTYGIPAKAKQPDVAAFFLNWVSTDAQARQIWFDRFGNTPTAPPGTALPTGVPGTLQAELLAEASKAEAADSLIDFLANATSGIYVSTLLPELQELIAGRVAPGAFVQKLQSSYAAELGR